MIPKSVYRQAYKDITEAYLKGKFNVQEWTNRLKGIYALFERDYPDEFLMEEQ